MIKDQELQNKAKIAELSWELKLCWREMKFCENQKTMEEYEKAMAHNVKKHNELMQCKWDKIEYGIQLKKKQRTNKSPMNIVNVSCEKQHSNSFENECNTAVLDHGKNILNQASEEFKFKGKDFTKDPKVFSLVFDKIKLIFDHVERHVLDDARKIIKHSKKDKVEQSKTSYKSSKGTIRTSSELTRNVSFGKVVSIGQSDQILQKGVLLKNTSDRAPTPTVSSLTFNSQFSSRMFLRHP